MPQPFGLMRRASLGLASFFATKGLQGLSELDRNSVGSSMLTGILNPRGAPPERNTRDLLEMYRKSPWLRAVTSKIAFAEASIPWILKFVTNGGTPVSISPARAAGTKDYRDRILAKQLEAGNDVVTVVNHPALDLIHNPNPILRGLAVRKIAQSHIELIGETFYLKERDILGNPIHLWTLPPHWVRTTPTIANPEYWVQWRGWSARIPDTEIIWACDPDPERPYWRGTGTGEALSDDLEADEYAAKFLKSTFYNNAIPELLITMENAREGEVKRLEQDWRKQNQGIFRQLRTYFLSRKVQVQQLGMNFRNLQLTQLREFERDTVVQVFGVPPEILGILKNSNRSTIEAAQFLFARWVLIPRLEMWREVYQHSIVDEFDDRLLIDYLSPVEEDFEKKLNAFKAAPYTVGLREWRALQGLPPDFPEDDVTFVPQALNAVQGSQIAEGSGNGEERSARGEEKEFDSMKVLGLTDSDRPRLAA